MGTFSRRSPTEVEIFLWRIKIYSMPAIYHYFVSHRVNALFSFLTRAKNGAALLAGQRAEAIIIELSELTFHFAMEY